MRTKEEIMNTIEPDYSYSPEEDNWQHAFYYFLRHMKALIEVLIDIRDK